MPAQDPMPAQQQWSIPVNPAMRASTADRERAVDVLKAAFAEGRLDQDEYNDRMGSAYNARTYGELVAVTGDLPAGPLPVAMSALWQGTRQPASRPQPARRVPQSQRTNAMATAAFALGMLEFLTIGLTAIPAIICAHIANHQIKRTGEQGVGMAAFALTFGYLALAIGGLVLVYRSGR